MEAKNALIDNSGQQSLSEIKIDSYISIFFFTIQDFLNWWYVKMPIWHLRRLTRLSVVVDDQFSISLLLKNFFLPWHRDNSMIGYLFGIVMKLLFFLFWLLLPIGSLVFIILSFFNSLT